jgi:predicted DNA-binding transcriptional regulator AlpA
MSEFDLFHGVITSEGIFSIFTIFITGSNTMIKSSDLFTIQEVCRYYGLSEQTIRRRIKEARAGNSSFPSPIFGYGRKALWHREDIENWSETESRQLVQDR